MAQTGHPGGGALSEEDRAVLRHALRVPRGRYDTPRAAQLSGIPERTLYGWAQSGVLVPDFHAARPIRWSYRDLVFVRLLARLRGHGMAREQAAQRVRLVRDLAAAGGDMDLVRLTDRSLLLPGERHDRFTGEQVLGDLAEMTGHFEVLVTVDGTGDEHLWGPNLVKPTPLTCISPVVLGGEPCVEGTRIPTAWLHALVRQRGLTPAQVLRLYPQLSEEQVEDAVGLEQRMRERTTAT